MNTESTGTRLLDGANIRPSLRRSNRNRDLLMVNMEIIIVQHEKWGGAHPLRPILIFVSSRLVLSLELNRLACVCCCVRIGATLLLSQEVSRRPTSQIQAQLASSIDTDDRPTAEETCSLP